MSKRLKRIEKELNSFRGIYRYKLESEYRLEYAKREKNDRMKNND